MPARFLGWTKLPRSIWCLRKWRIYAKSRAYRWAEIADDENAIPSKDLTAALSWGEEVTRECIGLFRESEPYIEMMVAESIMDKRVTPEMVRSETLDLVVALEEVVSAADKARGKVDTMLDVGARSLISQEEIAHRRTELDRLIEEQQQVISGGSFAEVGEIDNLYEEAGNSSEEASNAPVWDRDEQRR